MSRTTKNSDNQKKKRAVTPSFVLELPLSPTHSQMKVLRGHFEAARNLYNALLGEARTRAGRMRNSPAWAAARAIAKTPAHKTARKAAFTAAREKYQFSEYDLHKYATQIRQSWIGEHIDANTAQTLATRAFRAVQRIAVGQARKVRFRSKGRGIDCLEGKTNKQGIRFGLEKPQEGNKGYLVWGRDLQIATQIDWQDEVVRHGLSCPIKYVRLIRRRASSVRAKGADPVSCHRYYVQLVLEGKPYQKPKNRLGTAVVGLDIGPSSVAIVSQDGEAAELIEFCHALNPDAKVKRRLQRHLDRQRRANNPDNFDDKGRIVRPVKGKRLIWHDSRGYIITRHKLANIERKLAAHRKSLHGELVNRIIGMGNTIKLEKLSYRAFQKQYGKSVGMRGPGMFVARLNRTVANTGGTFLEFSTYKTKLSQYCHGCNTFTKKPLSQRWHHCPNCGLGPIQRDLYSAWLASWVSPLSQQLELELLPTAILRPAVTSATVEVAEVGTKTNEWTGVEERLRAVAERLQQQLAKEGVSYPRSFGLITRAGASLPQSRHRVSSNSEKIVNLAKTATISAPQQVEIVAERL